MNRYAVITGRNTVITVEQEDGPVLVDERGERAAEDFLVRVVERLAAEWRTSQEIGWNGWTNLEISWAVIMHRAHHGINPEMFFLAPPRLQVWWDRELAQYANWWNSSEENPLKLPPLDRIIRYFGNAYPYPPDGKFIGATSVTTWFEWSTDFQRGPRGTKFRHHNALVAHSPRFPIAGYLVAYALTLMEQP